jgi:hypothetical protein
MPKRMSFALTTPQLMDETKTETRRLGWSTLKPGEIFFGVEKCMGLKKGETHKLLKVLRCRNNRREELESIDKAAVIREGFPGMKPADFVAMFCKHNKCDPSVLVSVIQFTYVPRDQWDALIANRG